VKDYQIRFRSAAKREITTLRRYLERNFGEDKAKVILNSLQASIAKLGAMPKLGRDATELSPLLIGYRFLHLSKNTVFYKVHDDKKLVEILHVYDNRMDVLAHLLEHMEG
jgi:plasmid stabilization system protein ParE